MIALSEISLLYGANVGDIERAREVFTSDTRQFVSGIARELRRTHPTPWLSKRVRIDILPEIESEAKITGYLRAQYAVGRGNIRFKKGTKFVVVADVTFGILCRDEDDAFSWLVDVVPSARYPSLDDVLWQSWQRQKPAPQLPGGKHDSKSNSLCLCIREINSLTADVAYSDVKAVCDFVLASEPDIIKAIGLEGDDDSSSAVSAP